VEPDNGAGTAGGTHAGIGEFIDTQRIVSPFGQLKGDATSDNTRTNNDGIVFVFH
jgi:hypothetical protein